MSSFDQASPFFLKELSIRSFRNIAELALSFEPGGNLFIGPNGHGKTNCLEAIAMALTLRPMQSLQNIDLIRFDGADANILGSFAGSYPIDINLAIFPHGKKATINQQAVKNAASLGKLVSVVSFIPAELAMIQGAAALRRRALDQAAWSLFYEHLSALKAYDKIVLHRNKLLKSWPIDHHTLKIFTDLLIKDGAQVIHFRLKAIEAMEEVFLEKTQAILGPGNWGSLQYRLNDEHISHQTLSDLMARLERHKDRLALHEQKRKVTLFGPHLDDMTVLLNGHCAKKSASRGQSRALVLAFKLAHMIAILRLRGTSPVVILDDIISELDADKKANLLSVIADLKTQSFFSSTDLATFGGQIPSGRVFELCAGRLAG
jgi:DNA replication and repair protein RecF